MPLESFCLTSICNLRMLWFLFLSTNMSFFVDSITTSHEVNKFLINSNISSNDFILLHYSGNIDKRSEFDRRREFVLSNQTNKSEEYVKFFNHYWLYSIQNC